MLLAAKLPIAKAITAAQDPAFDPFVLDKAVALSRELPPSMLTVYYEKKFLENIKAKLVMSELWRNPLPGEFVPFSKYQYCPVGDWDENDFDLDGDFVQGAG